MTNKRSALDALHEATHDIPGVPAHADRPAGHQGDTHHGAAARTPVAGRRPRTRNHAPARPPRVLVAWQRRIAALFGQDV